MNKRETRVGERAVGVVMATARGVTPVPIWRHTQTNWGEMHPRYSAFIKDILIIYDYFTFITMFITKI